MKIHHIGYLVKNMDRAVLAFKELGYSVIKEAVLDDFRQILISFLEKNGYIIELVSPVTKESVVANLLKKQGNTPYHICYETESFDETLNHLMECHYVPALSGGDSSLVNEAPAIDGRRCCFLIHPYMGMIELLENSKK